MVLDRADVYNLVAHSFGKKDEAQTLSAGEARMEKRPKANLEEQNPNCSNLKQN